MTEYISVNGKMVVVSDDVDLLKEEKEIGNAVLLILNDSNRYKDTNLTKYCVTLDDNCSGKISELIDEDYLLRVIARHEGKPLNVTKSDRLTIRELCVGDSDAVTLIYKESEDFIEDFFDSESEIPEILSGYTSVYDIWDYGMWGVTLADSNELIGIAGLILRNEDELEVGYAFLKEYRGKGLAFEACDCILSYAKENYSYSRIFARVMERNTRGMNLAKKLQKKHGISIIAI